MKKKQREERYEKKNKVKKTCRVKKRMMGTRKRERE